MYRSRIVYGNVCKRHAHDGSKGVNKIVKNSFLKNLVFGVIAIFATGFLPNAYATESGLSSFANSLIEGKSADSRLFQKTFSISAGKVRRKV